MLNASLILEKGTSVILLARATASALGRCTSVLWEVLIDLYLSYLFDFKGTALGKRKPAYRQSCRLAKRDFN